MEHSPIAKYKKNARDVPVTIVMEPVERPEGRQSAHADAVAEEYLRGPFDPRVRVGEALPPRRDQIPDALAGAFQRHRPDQQRSHYQIREHRYEPHDLSPGDGRPAKQNRARASG